MTKEQTLPKDAGTDFSLPGRFEEANSDFDIVPSSSVPKNKTILVAALVFVIFSVGIFSYYFINQEEIDSKIMQDSYNMTPEQILANKYGVGEFGSAHAHAAIAVFINDEQLNFAQPAFQLSSKYIHFENHNPYLIHRHATDVPLDMLFTSFGIKITSDCIILNYDESETSANRFCTSQNNSLVFYVNEEKYSDISQYVLDHDDRILVSFGDLESISKHLGYLESLKIFDIPKKTPQNSGNDIFIWL